jgi:hypothetical protein
MEWAKLLVAAAAIFTTVSIAIGGWVLQRQKELQTADKKTSALYVNPFLDACNDLQGRIYNILMLDGLGPTTARGIRALDSVSHRSVFWMGRTRKALYGLRAGSKFHRTYREI